MNTSLDTPLFSGLEMLARFQAAFDDGNAKVSLNIDHMRVFLVIALATTQEEKIELRSLSGPNSPFGSKMTQTKMHRITTALKEVGLVRTQVGELDTRLFTIELTDKGHSFASKLSTLFVDDDEQTRPWRRAVDDVLRQGQQQRMLREFGMKAAEAAKSETNDIDWREKLKKALNDKGVENPEIGKNYIKTKRPNGDVRGAVSFPVLFKRTESEDLADLVVNIDGMSDDELDVLLTPNIKHRDVSDDALAELNSMIEKFGAVAIDQNPELSQRRALLSAQIAREATAKASK